MILNRLIVGFVRLLYSSLLLSAVVAVIGLVFYFVGLQIEPALAVPIAYQGLAKIILVISLGLGSVLTIVTFLTCLTILVLVSYYKDYLPWLEAENAYLKSCIEETKDLESNLDSDVRVRLIEENRGRVFPRGSIHRYIILRLVRVCIGLIIFIAYAVLIQVAEDYHKHNTK